MTIQKAEFADGSFVLHKVMVNGHKYSVWFDTMGVPFSAEMVYSNGNTKNVPQRCTNLFAEFKKIGARHR